MSIDELAEHSLTFGFFDTEFCVIFTSIKNVSFTLFYPAF